MDYFKMICYYNTERSHTDMFKEKKRQKKLKPPLSCDCYGLNYSDRNFQTHSVAEIDQQWRDDMTRLKQVLMEYEKKIIEERQREEAEAAAKKEDEANAKSDKKSRKKPSKKA